MTPGSMRSGFWMKSYSKKHNPDSQKQFLFFNAIFITSENCTGGNNQIFKY